MRLGVLVIGLSACGGKSTTSYGGSYGGDESSYASTSRFSLVDCYRDCTAVEKQCRSGCADPATEDDDPALGDPGGDCHLGCSDDSVACDKVCADAVAEDRAERAARRDAETSASESCATHEVSLGPVNPPPYTCGTVGPYTAKVMLALNEYFGSVMVACACGPDLPMCRNNAVAMSGPGRGYLYYDPDYLLDNAIFSDSLLAAAWVLAHEAGHHIQRDRGGGGGLTITQELSADCYSGAFLGWLKCRGSDITDFDMQRTLGSVCRRGDGAGVSWLDPRAHGQCTQRVAAVAQGMKAFESGADIDRACK